LPLYHKNLAFINHHLGPWFEGFTFIKDCTKDPERKSPNLPERASSTRRYYLLAIASYLTRHCELHLLAIASWLRATLQDDHFARHGEL
jgi:hypothetical protein